MALESLKTLLINNRNKLLEILSEAPAIEIAEFLENIDSEERLNIFLKLDDDIRGDVFCEFNTEIQNEFYENLSKRTFVSVFNKMPSESRADFYKQLSSSKQAKLLPFLPKNIREDVLLLSSYSDNSAGGIMSTDFASIYNDMTVGEALEKLKEDAPSKKMLYYAYVVDYDMKMLGFISLHDLILTDKNQVVSELIHNNFISAFVDDDKEEVSSMIERYSLIAIPILNHDNQLLGIVRYDDAINVIKNEQTEDLEKMMGISSYSDNVDYLSMSCTQNYYKRIGWLVGLFFLGILTSLILNKYEMLMTQIPILTPFFPMISAVGGNTGSQSSSVIIRALSLEEIHISDFFKVVFKEMKISIMIALTMFIFAFIEGCVISYFSLDTYKECINIATTVGISLLLQVVLSSIIGAALPLLVKMLKMDPAVIATPAIMTIVDVLGVVIYFTVATKLLL